MSIVARLGIGVVAALLLNSAGVVRAHDGLLASAYGPLSRDLMAIFHAEKTLCHAAIEVPDICFEVSAAGAGQLAELLETVFADYRGAGLRRGAWRSANGVWALELYFGEGVYGRLELFLTEVTRGEVRGMLMLRER